MQRYSALSLLRNSLSYHEQWKQAWQSPEPKRQYDVVIIGGGGHGLGAAHYLAKDHGITNVAVLEKGWLGGGNTGRNTMTVRSNFLREASVPFHEESFGALPWFEQRIELQPYGGQARHDLIIAKFRCVPTGYSDGQYHAYLWCPL